jgi:hypothetical protein
MKSGVCNVGTTYCKKKTMHLFSKLVSIVINNWFLAKCREFSYILISIWQHINSKETDRICAAMAALIGSVVPPRQCSRNSQLLKSSIRADHMVSAASVQSSQPETSRTVNFSISNYLKTCSRLHMFFFLVIFWELIYQVAEGGGRCNCIQPIALPH